jgi:hypothetical protein
MSDTRDAKRPRTSPFASIKRYRRRCPSSSFAAFPPPKPFFFFFFDEHKKDSPTLRRPNRAVFFRNIAVWRDAEDDAIALLLSLKNECVGPFFVSKKKFLFLFFLNPKTLNINFVFF